MFQSPLLGSLLPGLTKVSAPGQAGSEPGLTVLLQDLGEQVPGLSGELQAMLMQLSPQVLQRLDELLAGGTSLPDAAKTLLGEFAAEEIGQAFPELLKRYATGERAPAIAGDADGDAVLAAVPPRQPLMAGVSAEPGFAAHSPLVAAAGVSAATTSGPQTLPPQLANQLLDMGVPQQVGAKGWSNAVADRVIWMVQGEQQFARLKLNPPNLGPLEVRVSVNQDQTQVAFLAQHAAVRDALEAAIPRLREMFDQSSLQLVRADVGDPGADHGERSAGAGGDHTASGRGWDSEHLPISDIVEGMTPSVAGASLVDLFA